MPEIEPEKNSTAIHGRVTEIIKDVQSNPYTVEQEMPVGIGTISHMKGGRSTPKAEFFIRFKGYIKEKYGLDVSIDWMLTGTGRKYIVNQESLDDLNTQYVLLLKKYNKLLEEKVATTDNETAGQSKLK